MGGLWVQQGAVAGKQEEAEKSVCCATDRATWDKPWDEQPWGPLKAAEKKKKKNGVGKRSPDSPPTAQDVLMPRKMANKIDNQKMNFLQRRLTVRDNLSKTEIIMLTVHKEVTEVNKRIHF